VTPLASVITNIQFDHEQWLGHTLKEIAREKAGIIKPAIPVITGVEPGEALELIAGTARAQSSPLTVVHPPFADERLASLSLGGLHQRANAAVVLATIDVLQDFLPASTRAIQNGLAATVWPGRLQIVKKRNATFLLDGAHNPDGARTLAAALQTDFSGHEITLILGLFKDKAWPAMCEILVPHAQRTYLAPLGSERTADPATVREFCHTRWPGKEVRAFPSTAAALAEAAGDSFVVIAGSLHLVGEAMQELGIAASMHSERELNEWDAGRERAP
jgi:dihydrofolate synthase/folylpolyglutamate synthase